MWECSRLTYPRPPVLQTSQGKHLLYLSGIDLFWRFKQAINLFKSSKRRVVVLCTVSPTCVTTEPFTGPSAINHHGTCPGAVLLHVVAKGLSVKGRERDARQLVLTAACKIGWGQGGWVQRSVRRLSLGIMQGTRADVREDHRGLHCSIQKLTLYLIKNLNLQGLHWASFQVLDSIKIVFLFIFNCFDQ